MLVRNIKCPNCSATKVNEITTGYIYCDYCGTLMGYDMKNMQDEATSVFSADNYRNKLQSEFTRLSMEMGEALKNKDNQKYLETRLKLHEVEFDLFPKRYGPKGKQPAYRKRYMKFYEAMYKEQLEDGLLDQMTEFSQKMSDLSASLNYEIIDNKPVYQWDDNFQAFIDANSEYLKSNITKEKLENASYMQYYPEYYSELTPDMMYRNGVNNFLAVFDEEIVKKCISHLGLEDEYIEIEPVAISEVQCVVCAIQLKVPEGSSSVVCEQCGTKNKIKEQELECLNCGASYKPQGDEVKCEYCGAHAQTVGKKKEAPKPEVKQEKKKGFFARLFGS